ncbi:MAG: hypothetical protein MUO76_14190, partial [Anaerolineaceae bacterium]|nr:hypothetical protein [Anaerolineaceae bacterium]
ETILTFDAIPGKTYHGVVSEIATVSKSAQGVVEFTVTIALTDHDEDVKPEMTAAVNIVVEQFEDILLVPNRAVRMLNGKRVVYIQGADGDLVPAVIELGASSDIYSQVTGGELREGNLIIINPPADLSSFQPGSGQASEARELFMGGN